jgi:hypothetical protein
MELASLFGGPEKYRLGKCGRRVGDFWGMEIMVGAVGALLVK